MKLEFLECVLQAGEDTGTVDSIKLTNKLKLLIIWNKYLIFVYYLFAYNHKLNKIFL